MHHTSNVAGGIQKCIELTKPGGRVFIGLYHKYGRKPFLEYFSQLKAKTKDENYLFEKYRELDGRHEDLKQSKSWFLDQVLHPYETQHTLQDVMNVFTAHNVRMISTSINQFAPWDSIEKLYVLEKDLYNTGKKFLEQGKYYPGFFYVLGEKEV